MIQFTALIKKFDKQGEKTGWTYIEIPAKIAAQLKPAIKTSFRVKGRLDYFEIEKVALLPMGEGNFILVLNADLRKGIKKQKGATLEVRLQADEEPLQVNAEFLECLQDEPKALSFFNSLQKGHQLYFSKWIESAKTETTKAKRIAMAVDGLSKSWGYPEMIRASQKQKS